MSSLTDALLRLGIEGRLLASIIIVIAVCVTVVAYQRAKHGSQSLAATFMSIARLLLKILAVFGGEFGSKDPVETSNRWTVIFLMILFVVFIILTTIVSTLSLTSFLELERTDIITCIVIFFGVTFLAIAFSGWHVMRYQTRKSLLESEKTTENER